MIIHFRAPRTVRRLAGATLFQLALLLGFAAPPAAAQEFDVPDGFIARHEAEIPEPSVWRPVLTVRPEPGPFSEFSA
ncbi:MAG: hypothetical protein V3U93_00715, partial [Alphaproteobacteria bacterium]